MSLTGALSGISRQNAISSFLSADGYDEGTHGPMPSTVLDPAATCVRPLHEYRSRQIANYLGNGS